MVELKQPNSTHWTRRSFISAVALGALAVMEGCTSSSNSGGSQPIVKNLPDASIPSGDGALVPSPDFSYSPPSDTREPAYSPPAVAQYVPESPNGIYPRSAWTTAGPARPYQPMDGINLLTFHHDGDPRPFYDSGYWQTARYLETIRSGQIHRGFQDIGYHFAIDREGRVWQLRPLEFRGQHVRDGWNDHNIGVVVLGNFMLQEPTTQQKEKICSFGSLLRRQYGLSIRQVKTHQELVSTECPGVNMEPYMKYVRRNDLI